MKGIIINWVGTLASIPSNWLLCDGNNSTPNLLGKYLLSVGTSEDPGTTGGAATHTHSSTAHTHTQDAHGHTGGTTGATGGGISSTAGGTSGSTNSHTHSFSISGATATNQNTTVTSDTGANEPPYYKVAPIIDSSVAGVQYPVGSLIFWNLSVLPIGWSLCDGSGGTPDLRNKFLKCVDAAENPGGTGGTSTHTHTGNSHNHTQEAHTHSGSTGSPSSTATATGSGNLPASSSHGHAVTTSSVAATNQVSNITFSTENGEPTFKKILIIKNTGVANRPKYSICIWTGTITNIPLGYVLCNGSNGTPDLRDYFIQGALDSSELLNTGGNSAHTHTASSHNHTQDSHIHSNTLGSGSATSAGSVSPLEPRVYYIHTHSASGSATTATNQATTITVSNCSSQANYPPYYKVAYIMQDRDLDLTGANLMQMLL